MDYRGDIGVILENTEPKIKDFTIEDGRITSVEYGKSYPISKGERIAQLRLVKVPQAVFLDTNNITETDRGEGGFGSTGK